MSEKEIEKAKEELKELYRLLNPKPSISTNAIKTILQYIEELENKIEAKEMEHEYDIKMIDEVKGEAVKLYKEIDKLNKIIDEMADIINNCDIDYSDICKYRIVQRCEKAPEGCKECVKKYFEKKVGEE